MTTQTLPVDRWELVLVDNASPTPLTKHDFGIDQLPNARIVQEPKPGLTYGRLAGIANSSAPAIVFVDDDNVLAPNYLALALENLDRRPRVGLLSGRSLPEWERSPASWVREFVGNLALKGLEAGQEKVAGATAPLSYPDCAPVGAGLVGRRVAILPWVSAVQSDEKAATGRKGTELTSGEDCDIVLYALRAGWEVGYFPDLELTHLIPAGRLTREYHGRLNHGIAKSWVQVLGRHGIRPWPAVRPWTVRLRKWRAYFRYRAWAGPAEYVRWRGACGQFEGRAALSEATS